MPSSIFLIFNLLVINSSSELYDISEEASPIREGDRIVGMDYSVTLGEDVKGNNVNIATSILSSIVHYKDINSINDFYIDYINKKFAYEPVEEETEFETAVTEGEEYLAEVDECENEPQIQEITETLPAQSDEHNIEFVMDGEEVTEDSHSQEEIKLDDNYNLMYTEIETPSEIKSRYSEPYVPSESDKMFISQSEECSVKTKEKEEKNKKSTNITIVLLVMLLSISLLAVLYLLVLRPMTTGADVGQYIKEIFGMTDNNSLV